MKKTTLALVIAAGLAQIGAASAEGLNSHMQFVESIPVTQQAAVKAKRCEVLLGLYQPNIHLALKDVRSPDGVRASRIAVEARSIAAIQGCDMTPFIEQFVNAKMTADN